MSSRIAVQTYEAITDFYSKALAKTFKPGEIIRAPQTLGTDWVKRKVAKQVTTTKQIKP
jgi:hypothetical protein